MYDYNEETDEWGKFNSDGSFSANTYHNLDKSNTPGHYGLTSGISLDNKSVVVGGYANSSSGCMYVWQWNDETKEWGKYGIRSNAICPGLIKTKFSSALWQNEKLKKQIEKHLPAGRVAEPIEMSGLAVYLSSSAASYTTGGIYTADGGHMTM